MKYYILKKGKKVKHTTSRDVVKCYRDKGFELIGFATSPGFIRFEWIGNWRW